MNKYEILHLDDSPMFTVMVKLLIDDIDELDISYTSVVNIEDTEQFLKRNIPDLFIIDLMLENDWDPSPGVEFIKKVKSDIRFKSLTIMVLSCRDDVKEELRDYISYYEIKAFRPSRFKELVKKILIENSYKSGE